MNGTPEIAVCPTCHRPLVQPRHGQWAGNHGGYMRHRRASLALRGLCNACGLVPAVPGRKKCQPCADIAYARKRKAARIHSKVCHCGKPAAREFKGRFLCRSHFKSAVEWERMGK